jgi:hypothetical protein
LAGFLLVRPICLGSAREARSSFRASSHAAELIKLEGVHRATRVSQFFKPLSEKNHKNQ